MATTPNGYGRFIGRVGGLAVALGIGVAIANGAAIASADDGQSGSSKSSSADSKSADSASSDSTSGESKGDHKSAVRRPTHGTVTTESSTTASTNVDAKSTDAKTAGSHEDADESSSSGPRSRKIAAKTTISQPSSAETSSVATASAVTAHTPAVTAPTSSVATASAVTAPTSSVATASAVTAHTPAVSPLGTPEQLAAEQQAAETVNTLPVQLMELVLQFGWMSTARQQFAVVQGPDQANTDALKTAVDEHAMGAAFQQQLLDPMTPTAVMQVAPPHVWYGQDVGGSRILYDNPDTIYRFMGVNETSSYVITGRFTGEEMPADTSFSVLTGLSGRQPRF